MNKDRETFSAFLDDELSASERNEQIHLLSEDVNLKYSMQRYQMIGQILRGEAGESADFHFHSKVMQQVNKIQNESTAKPAAPAQDKTGFWEAWFKPLSGLAIAASVAWVAIFSLQGVMQNDSGLQNAQSVADASQQKLVSEQVRELAQLPVTSHVQQVSSSVGVLNQADRLQWRTHENQQGLQNKLNSYLLNHTEYSNSMQGIIPQARVAGFDVHQ